MKGEDYRRILDFFFSGVEVSEELKHGTSGGLPRMEMNRR